MPRPGGGLRVVPPHWPRCRSHWPGSRCQPPPSESARPPGALTQSEPGARCGPGSASSAELVRGCRQSRVCRIELPVTVTDLDGHGPATVQFTCGTGTASGTQPGLFRGAGGGVGVSAVTGPFVNSASWVARPDSEPLTAPRRGLGAVPERRGRNLDQPLAGRSALESPTKAILSA